MSFKDIQKCVNFCKYFCNYLILGVKKAREKDYNIRVRVIPTGRIHKVSYLFPDSYIRSFYYGRSHQLYLNALLGLEHWDFFYGKNAFYANEYIEKLNGYINILNTQKYIELLNRYIEKLNTRKCLK